MCKCGFIRERETVTAEREAGRCTPPSVHVTADIVRMDGVGLQSEHVSWSSSSARLLRSLK